MSRCLTAALDCSRMVQQSVSNVNCGSCTLLTIGLNNLSYIRIRYDCMVGVVFIFV